MVFFVFLLLVCSHVGSFTPTPLHFSPKTFLCSTPQQYDFYKILSTKSQQVFPLEDLHSEVNDPVRLAIDFMEVDSSRMSEKLGVLVENLRGEAKKTDEGEKVDDSPFAMGLQKPWSFSVDLKRDSPTPFLRGALSTFPCNFGEAGNVAEYFHTAHGVNCFFVNVDSTFYGGSFDDLERYLVSERSEAWRGAKRRDVRTKTSNTRRGNHAAYFINS